jgi:polysaccharide export outer membrane protein
MPRILHSLKILATAMLFCALAQAQSAPTNASSGAEGADRPADTAHQDSGFQQRYPRYTLRPADSFEVDFTFSPEFNQTVVVGPDGYVTFRGGGSWHVAGETLPQLTETIKQAYSGILHDPSINVVLKDFEKPYFIAAGQIAKPGKYEIRSDLSLVEAVNVAGGFTDAAKHSKVVLFRRMSNDMVEARVYDVKKMLNEHNLQEDPQLRPGDMVYVPKNAISKIQRYIPTSSLGLYANPIMP